MKKFIVLITAMMALVAAQTALASDNSHHMDGDMHGSMHDDMEGHDQMKGDMSDMKDQGKMKDMFLVKKEIDGFTVNFHAMKAKEGMQHGGSHNFMVKVERDGKALTDLMMNSKVTHPNGKSESKMLMKKGGWYMAGYDLDHDGQHQLMVLFKTADGGKHFVGVNYPKDDQ